MRRFQDAWPLAVLALAALPFLDRGPRRHPLDRPFVIGGVLLGLGLFLLGMKNMSDGMQAIAGARLRG